MGKRLIHRWYSVQTDIWNHYCVRNSWRLDMKKPKQIKKLVLRKERVACLNESEMNIVKGGGLILYVLLIIDVILSSPMFVPHFHLFGLLALLQDVLLSNGL
jgi:natural product precursor